MFIDGVSRDWSRIGLYRKLREFGKIIAFEIPVTGGPGDHGSVQSDGTFMYQGFGFVQYLYPEDADSARMGMESKGRKDLFLRKCNREYDMEQYCNWDLRRLDLDRGPRVCIGGREEVFLNMSPSWDHGLELVPKRRK